MSRHQRLVIATVLLAACFLPGRGVAAEPDPSGAPGTATPTRAAPTRQGLQEAVAGMEHRDGYFPIYWDPATGRLHLHVVRIGEDFLYLPSLSTGIGSNGLGLDRGQIGGGQIARFERTGGRVYLVIQNPGFRAVGGGAALRRSVEESFPTSTVGAFGIVAEDQRGPLIDATDYFLGDVMDIAARLQQAGQGDFSVDATRSRIWEPRTRAFPDNTEIEAALTFVSRRPGQQVRAHTPDGRAMTIRQHHSLVKLPDDGYVPRRFDPRVGIFATSYYDYTKSFDTDYVTRYMTRHRLVKRDPAAAMSEPVEPIVYYLDPAVPEPYRTAFREGGAWWNDMFAEAGFIDAFRIEDMPADMDAMDARYHVIQWVHRTEAGSSIGPSFRDPRTGEIIKAAVRMDSHRSLVDYNLYAGTLPAGLAGSPEPAAEWLAQLDDEVSAEDFVMARRRQHSAHEIGHTLGLAHNFIAASYGRASVMDYPAPLIRLEDGRIDLSDAYAPGPGEYDAFAIRYAYSELPAEREQAELEAMVREAQERGWLFITNSDEAASGSYPEATTWINGGDPVEELERVAAVRAHLVERFDATAIEPGEPMWRLNERFVPVYLHHRYTLTAAIKAIGGMEFRYAVAGDPSPPTRILDPERQRRALRLLLRSIEPAALRIPESVLELMAPRPFGYRPDRRAFASAGAPAFDQVGVARTLATMVVGGILDPARAARLVAFSARDERAPTLEEVVATLVDEVFDNGGEDPLARVAERAVVDALVRLSREGTSEGRAGAEWGLRRVLGILQQRGVRGSTAEAHVAAVAADIQRFLERPEAPATGIDPLAPPPGTPIGASSGDGQ